jgi:hypothetical protein
MKRKSGKGNEDKPLEKRGGFGNIELKSTSNNSKSYDTKSIIKISI